VQRRGKTSDGRLRSFARGLGVNRGVLALSAARLGDAVGNSILFIILPLYVDRLAAPWFPVPESVRVGILISLYGLVVSLVQPLTGAISDHLGQRKILIQVGLLVMGGGTLAFMLARTFTDLLVLRALQGIGVALTVPAAMALMAAYATPESRGGSMGAYTTMRMLGFTIGPLIGGVVEVRLGFDAAFWVGGGFIFLALALVQLWVKEVPVRRPAANPKPGRRFQIIDRSLLSPGILGAAGATFLMASSFTMMATLEKQFNMRLGETAEGFSIAFSALMVSRLIFQVPLGRLSDRLGRKPLIISGLLLMAPSTALLGLAATTAGLTGLRLVQGIGAAAIAAPSFALAADVAREGGEGRQMSIVTMGFSLGIALGPLMAGLLAVPLFELPFLAGGALCLAGAWSVYRWVPETTRARSQPS
jgi:MFS family permease